MAVPLQKGATEYMLFGIQGIGVNTHALSILYDQIQAFQQNTKLNDWPWLGYSTQSYGRQGAFTPVAATIFLGRFVIISQPGLHAIIASLTIPYSDLFRHTATIPSHALPETSSCRGSHEAGDTYFPKTGILRSLTAVHLLIVTEAASGHP